jgi:hypothetical protein
VSDEEALLPQSVTSFRDADDDFNDDADDDEFVGDATLDVRVVLVPSRASRVVRLRVVVVVVEFVER